MASFAAPDAPPGGAGVDVVVRRADLADAPALAAVARRAFREAYAAVTRPADLERHLAVSFGEGCQAAELADPEVVAWLAEAGGEPIGYAMLRRGPAPGCVPGPRPMQLWRCYVLEAWHGRGVAGRLMHSAVAEASRRGAGTLWLSVWERNARALAFYRKSGFDEVGDAIFPVGDDRQRDRVMVRPLENAVRQHYGRPGLLATIERGLREAGKDPRRPGLEDLAPLDQFHTRGLDATLELAALAGIQGGDRVLDLGGGIGGSARVLAERHGATVTVLDLTTEYGVVGAEPSRRAGLGHLVRFVSGDAVRLPFEAGGFDVVWSQHGTMNIRSKPALYSAARRMLRAGGRLAWHEIFAGPLQPIHFPVPWASGPGISHLALPGAARAEVCAAGFRELAWHDVTAQTLEWARGRTAAAGDRAPPSGLHLPLGEPFPPAFANLVRNLEEDRLRVVMALFGRMD